jgi:hypothetical protein
MNLIRSVKEGTKGAFFFFIFYTCRNLPDKCYLQCNCYGQAAMSYMEMRFCIGHIHDASPRVSPMSSYRLKFSKENVVLKYGRKK